MPVRPKGAHTLRWQSKGSTLHVILWSSCAVLCGCWYHLAPFGLSCDLHLLLVACRYNNIGKVFFLSSVLWCVLVWKVWYKSSQAGQPCCVFLPHLLLQMRGMLYFMLVCSTREFCSICTSIMTNLVSLAFADGTRPYSLKSFEIIFFQRGDRK